MDLKEEVFEKTKIAIKDIIEDYAIKYPLDVFDLCDKMGFELIPYSHFIDRLELLLKKSKDGFSMFHHKRNMWTIYYNDDVEPKDRIKFTIAHEIGHILLQTEIEEYANFFAGYLLAPVVLIVEYKLFNQQMIMDYFEVGYQCASSCLHRATKRILHDSPYTEYEKLIIESQK